MFHQVLFRNGLFTTTHIEEITQHPDQCHTLGWLTVECNGNNLCYKTSGLISSAFTGSQYDLNCMRWRHTIWACGHVHTYVSQNCKYKPARLHVCARDNCNQPMPIWLLQTGAKFTTVLPMIANTNIHS